MHGTQNLPSDKELLAQSLAKWKKNAKAKRPDEVLTGPKDCPLCVRYNNDVDNCRGCAIYSYTRRTGCVGCPYTAVVMKVSNWERYPEDPIAKEAAMSLIREEVDLLEMLLGRLTFDFERFDYE